jgi:hypothetical protein
MKMDWPRMNADKEHEKTSSSYLFKSAFHLVVEIRLHPRSSAAVTLFCSISRSREESLDVGCVDKSKARGAAHPARRALRVVRGSRAEGGRRR